MVGISVNEALKRINKNRLFRQKEACHDDR